MNGISELLSRYGTSLEETRKLAPQLTEAVKRKRVVRPPAFPQAPQLFDPVEAKEMGVQLDPGWMLKVVPPVDGQEPKISLITPENWEILEDQTVISPEGKLFTREELEVQLAAPEVPLEVEQVFGRVFLERDVRDVLAYAEAQPEAFYADILAVGRIPETEDLLRTAFQATPEQVEEFFAPLAPTPRYITPEGKLLFTEVEVYQYYAEAYTGVEYEKLPDWIKVFGAGAGDLLVTAAGAAKWLGKNEIAENLSKYGQALQPIAADIPTQANWDTLFSPRFYEFRPTAVHGYQALRALPFTISLAPAAILGAYGGAAIAGAVGLGTLGATIMATLGASIMAAPMEAALEAGQTFDEALYKGLSSEEAREAANTVFRNNTFMLTGSNWAEFLVAFAPMPARVPANLIARGLVTTARVAGKVVITGLTEAGEEAVQEVFQRQALGEDIVLDDEMKAAIAIGGMMGMGLGVGGSVFTSIRHRTINSLPDDLQAQIDEKKKAYETEGYSPEVAETKAIDEVAAVNEEVAKKIAEATEAVKQAELLRQVKPKTDAEQVAWEHMFPEFPEATTLVEVPMTLKALREMAKPKGYTISELTVPLTRMPTAKFRITGKGVRVYARNMAEVENFLQTGSLVIPAQTLTKMKAELASALFEASKGKGYFQDVAGFQGAVDKMSEAEVRDLHAMYSRTGKIVEIARPEVPVVEPTYTAEEITRMEAELGGLKEWLSTEPARKLVSLVKKVGWYKGEVSNLTLRQYRTITGKSTVPASIKTPDGKHVRWEYALDDVATEMGYSSGEDLKYAIENTNEALARIKSLESDLAGITPEDVAEAELFDNRARMLETITEPRVEDEIPRGIVKHPSQYKGQEDFTAEVNQEMFAPIRESALDTAACAYWRSGDFDEYIRLMPDIGELKLRALSDEVNANITELEDLLTLTNRAVETLGVEISLEKPGTEKFKVGQQEVAQLERDVSNIEEMIKDLKGGERLTVEQAAALGIALRRTKGGRLIPAIRESGFFVTTEFAESPHLSDVGFLSGRAMDVDTLFEAIDGGRAAGTPADPAVAQKYVLWGTNRTHLARNKFVNTYHQVAQDMFEKYNLIGDKELIRASFDIVQQIGTEDVAIPVEELAARPEIRELLKKHRPEARTRLVGFAQEARVFLDEMFRMQNEARAKRGQDAIKYRKDYLAWVAETNIWSKLGWGQKTPSDIFQKPPLPDYIKPDAPFNPRAMAREGGMAGYEMEKDVHKLLFDYVRTAGKDIFNTNIIHNAKIHVAAMRSMGLENSARLVEDWASEAYAGVKPSIEKAAEAFIPKPMLRAAYMLRRNLTRAVFPLNWMWNITIQPSSIAFTVGRYGVRNTIRGLEYLFMPSAKAQVRDAYSYITKSRRGGKMAFQDIGAQVEKNLKWEGSFVDKTENLANFMTNTIEQFLTGVSVRAAHHYGEQLGFEGRDLLEYASKGGAKTQSMYNYENVPAVLRAKPVGTLFPFQTFCFQAFNYIRELNFIGRWKAGAYETISAKSAEGKATISRRIKLFTEFLIVIMIINMVVDKATNRKPWVLSSFIPFFRNLTMGADATNPWNWPIPVQYATEFWNAFQAAIRYEDFRKLRKWAIRYHMIGGTQINRMIDGIEAVLKGGVYDIRGTEMFEVEPGEWLKAIFMGPYQTEGGREYIDNMSEKKGKWYEYIGIPLPRRVSIKNEINKSLAMLGQPGEDGQIHNFGDFVSDLREIRRSVGDKRFEGCDSPFIEFFLRAEESRDKYELYVLEHWDGMIPEEIRAVGMEPGQGQRDEWRASHTEDDALLAMFGYGGRIQTQKAYDLVKQWCEELGIPMEHLSTWLPPEKVAETYFKYVEAANEFGGGSAEARLLRAEDGDFQAWGKEAYDWKDIDVHIEALRISVKWGELDDMYDKGIPERFKDITDITLRNEKIEGAKKALLLANPEYADDRRRRDAYSIKLPDNLIETYVDWHKTTRKGYEDDWFLMEHKDFYDKMVKLDQLKERDFSKVPDIKYKGLWADWVEMDERYELAEDKEAFRKANDAYRKVLRKREGIKSGLPDERLDDYVGYYEVPPKAEAPDSWWRDNPKETYYEDDWWLQAHPELEQAMVDLYKETDGEYGWKELRDYSKVPTKEVHKKYRHWLTLDKGKDRRDYEGQNSDLDMWLHLTTGTKLETDKPPTEPEDKEPETPFEKKQRELEEARRLREWLESLKSETPKKLIKPPALHQVPQGEVEKIGKIISEELPSPRVGEEEGEPDGATIMWDWFLKGASDLVKRIERNIKPYKDEPYWPILHNLLEPLQEIVRKDPKLSWWELLEGVEPPAPRSYKIGEEIEIKTPQDIWRQYFADYQVPTEGQKRIAKYEIEVLPRLVVKATYPEGWRNIGGWAWWPEEDIKIVSAFKKNPCSRLMAHELAHSKWFNELTPYERKEFWRLMNLPENKELKSRVTPGIGAVYKEGVQPTEAHATLYANYPWFKSWYIPKYFDKFYPGLDVAKLREDAIRVPIERLPTSERERGILRQELLEGVGGIDLENYNKLKESGWTKGKSTEDILDKLEDMWAEGLYEERLLTLKKLIEKFRITNEADKTRILSEAIRRYGREAVEGELTSEEIQRWSPRLSEEEELGEPSMESIQKLVSQYKFTRREATLALAVLNYIDFAYQGKRIKTEAELFDLIGRMIKEFTPSEIVIELQKAAQKREVIRY